MSGNPKIAVVTSQLPSVWGSCRVITPNLATAYRAAFGPRLEFFDLNPRSPASDVWNLSRRIYDTRPERIVFLDHAPHPIQLLLALRERYGKKSLPPLYFHVYGDFTLYLESWSKLMGIFSSSPPTYICASAAQAKLVGSLLQNPGPSAVQICPFPVDRRLYKFDPDLRIRTREKLGLGRDTFALIYTGRLSLQKNTKLLFEWAGDLLSREKIDFKIFVAGAFDDLGAPLFGIREESGDSFQSWNTSLAAMPAKTRERIQFLGHFEPEELAGLYNAGDLYASLSLHHDEDFGMSPAEALCCGTRSTLTGWGGFRSFGICPESCSLVPVKIWNYGLLIDTGAFEKNLLAVTSPETDAKKKTRSDLYLKSFSIEAATEKLIKIHKEKRSRFSGYSARMARLLRVKEKGVQYPFGPAKDTIYEEIYESYIK